MYADDTQIYLAFKLSVPGDLELCQARVEACVRDIDSWMLINNLKLNNDKTELLVLHSKYRCQPPIESMKVGESPVIPSLSAKNIGVLFDTTMNLEDHVKSVCKGSFYHIRNISKIRRFLTVDATKTLVNAFVVSRIDYCNALLYGLPDRLLQRLQNVLIIPPLD